MNLTHQIARNNRYALIGIVAGVITMTFVLIGCGYTLMLIQDAIYQVPK